MPGVNAPKVAGMPSESASVAGTGAPTLTAGFSSRTFGGVCESSQEFQQTSGWTTPLIWPV